MRDSGNVWTPCINKNDRLETMKDRTKGDNIQIVLSVYDLADDYLRHACTTIVSILENTEKKTIFHILLYKGTNIENNNGENQIENKFRLDSLIKKYNAEIIYHYVSIPEWYLAIPAMKSYHIGTLLRLFIPEILAENKVIYLDCDVVVTLDIKELWEINVENYPLAACPDTEFPKSLGIKYHIPKIKKLYRDTPNIVPYFNAGVLLLNLTYLRSNASLSEFSAEYLEKYPYAPFSDQDVLNAYCNGKYIQLDRKYNIFSDKVSDKEVGECCIHYCDRKKPWMIYSGKIDDQYWNYFSLTPWADNPKALVEYVRLAPDLNYINRIKLEPLRKQAKTIFCLLEIVVKNMYTEFKKFKKYL